MTQENLRGYEMTLSVLRLGFGLLLAWARTDFGGMGAFFARKELELYRLLRRHRLSAARLFCAVRGNDGIFQRLVAGHRVVNTLRCRLRGV